MLSVKSYKITNIERTNENTVVVKVRVCAREWARLKSKGELGQLYGIDISNEAYQVYGVQAYRPTVNDHGNASGGLKWIELFYEDSTWMPVPDNVIRVDFIIKKRVA